MNEKIIKEKLVLKKQIKILLNKILMTTIIFLIGMITIKQNPILKKEISKSIYEKSFKFTKAKTLYQKYFGNILSIDKIIKEEVPVFSENLSYSSKESYKDGVKLIVTNNYLVPIIESGIIVFIGEKEDYGNTIVIEQVNGIDTFYSNIDLNSNYKLYDYVEKGEMLGETKNNELILTFQKNGVYLDYQQYI